MGHGENFSFFLCTRWGRGNVLSRGETGSDFSSNEIPSGCIWRMDWGWRVQDRSQETRKEVTAIVQASNEGG